MKLASLQAEMDVYDSTFHRFVSLHQLPAEWFLEPDHVAVKCADKDDYTDTISSYEAHTDEEGIWELSLDGRLLASAGLARPVTLAGHAFSWIEIMQPRPGKETAKGFVEHTEFYYPDFDSASTVLQERGIGYEIQRNDGHGWINIPIDGSGREIKLNDKALADVVIWERAQGLLRRVQVYGR
jgi:predicted metalloenzyme YecM